MIDGFSISVRWDDGMQQWRAEADILKGVYCHGETKDDACMEMTKLAEEWMIHCNERESNGEFV